MTLKVEIFTFPEFVLRIYSRDRRINITVSDPQEIRDLGTKILGEDTHSAYIKAEVEGKELIIKGKENVKVKW